MVPPTTQAPSTTRAALDHPDHPPAPTTVIEAGWHDLRTAFSRVGWELGNYVRRIDALVFTFAFPMLLLLVFSAAFGSMGDLGGGVTMTDYYLPAMIAAAIALSGIQGLGIDIAGEKSDGTLRRLAATPLRPWQYFAGKLGLVLVTTLAQVVLLIAVATLALGVRLPTTAGAWWTFAWVFLLGLATCCLLGIALSALPRSGKSAVAVVIPIMLVLQFISGIFLPFSMLPGWLQTVAGLFPLRWVAQGLRAAFLPESFAAGEVGGDWALGTVALVLLAWLVVGGVLAKLTFRWLRRT